MPVNPTNSLGSLEVQDPSVPASFLLKLNDRLRRISTLISGGNTTINNTTTTQVSGGAGEVALTVPGLLAIQSNAAAALTLGASTSFSTVTLLLKEAPQGGSVTVQLYVGGTAWGPRLSLTGTAATMTAGGTIAANALIRLDVVGVGTGAFPGSDLTAILR